MKLFLVVLSGFILLFSSLLSAAFAVNQHYIERIVWTGFIGDFA